MKLLAYTIKSFIPIATIFLLVLGLNTPFAYSKSKPTYASKMQLAQLLYFNGNVDGAINAFLYAASLNPNAFEPHLSLVNLYVQRGEVDKAIEHCYEGIRIKPKNKDLHLVLGNLLRTQGKLTEALEEIQKAKEAGAPEALCENTMGMIHL
jgi:lipopolysaccharide biosynthesis regulator YciM